VCVCVCAVLGFPVGRAGLGAVQRAEFLLQEHLALLPTLQVCREREPDGERGDAFYLFYCTIFYSVLYFALLTVDTLF